METGTLSQLRHLTRTSIAAELAAAPAGLDQLAGVHDLVVDQAVSGEGAGRWPGCAARSTPAQLDELLRLLVAAGVRSLVSQPPTLEELFLRHYARQDAAPAAVRA